MSKGSALTPSRRALLRLPAGVIRCALIVRVIDEWWSWLPAGTIENQRTDLGISYAQAGWLLALLTVGGLVGAPLAAIADRGHRRLMAVTGATVLAAGLTTFALGAPFVGLAIACAAMGGASDLLIRPLESSMAELADDDLDRLLGKQHLIAWLGDFVGPAVIAICAATVLGWQGAFAVTAVTIGIYGVVLAMTEFPAPAPVEEDEPSLWQSARSLARMPEVLALSAAEFILLPLDEAFLGFAVARLVADDFGAAAQILAGSAVVGGLAGAALISREGLVPSHVRFGALVMMVGAGCTAGIPFVAAHIVGMVLVGFGTAVVWAKVHHRSLTVVPGRSATVPTVMSMLSTPSLLVAVAMGWIADRWSITAALVAAASLTVPLAVVVGMLGGGRVDAESYAEVADD